MTIDRKINYTGLYSSLKRLVKAVIWGYGAMGSTIADIILDKKGIEIIGVCDINPEHAGMDFIEVLGRENKKNAESIIIESDIERIIKPEIADVVILATDSFTRRAFPKIKYILENRINVISTAEEMSYPYASEPELAEELNQIALKNSVTVIGTEINPGFYNGSDDCNAYRRMQRC